MMRIKVLFIGSLLLGCGGDLANVNEGAVQSNNVYWTFPLDFGKQEELDIGWEPDNENIAIVYDTSQNRKLNYRIYDLSKKNIRENISEKKAFEIISAPKFVTGIYASFMRDRKMFEIDYAGEKVDLSYKVLTWPLSSKLKKIELEGITGDMVISGWEHGLKVPLAKVALKRTYIQNFEYNRFFLSPRGQYLVFVSKVDPKKPLAYVFKREE